MSRSLWFCYSAIHSSDQQRHPVSNKMEGKNWHLVSSATAHDGTRMRTHKDTTYMCVLEQTEAGRYSGDGR